MGARPFLSHPLPIALLALGLVAVSSSAQDLSDSLRSDPAPEETASRPAEPGSPQGQDQEGPEAPGAEISALETGSEESATPAGTDAPAERQPAPGPEPGPETGQSADAEPGPAPDRTAQAEQPSLRKLLEPQIQAGRIEIEERSDRQLVIVRGDALFRSAEATVKQDFLPLLRDIGEALDRVEGRVLVVGYTDAVPIATARFPSNQALSEARAENVREVLEETLDDPARLAAEGRGADEPRIPDDPRDPRNRRVEIALVSPASAP